MGQTLVIAEKPSVASDIAKALGGFKKDGDFWVSDTMLIGSAVGHLLELAAPEEYDVKRGRWSFANLPVIPPHFDLRPIKKSVTKFETLARKMRSRTVTDIINACDAGREGELIFRYIMQAARCKKPVRRLWLQSMTAAAIRKAFENLRTDEEMKPLEAAARSRSEADWLVGINGTRALTAFNSKDGGFFLTTVGRVQTPTLAIVVAREEEIHHFVSKPYWTVKAVFGAAAGEYESLWQDAKFVKTKGQAPELKAERLWSEEEALRIVERCRGQSGVVTEAKKRSTSMSPALFDLTSLQREANSSFGFPARMTLAIAQRLYERHKVLTYPRTDARALPEDYIPTVYETLEHLGHLGDYAKFAGTIVKNRWVKQDKRVFDNTKISDHFAIIPTGELPKELDETEQKIYDLVVRRFMSVFYPAAEFDVTTRTTTVGEDRFVTEGKVLVTPGWMEVAGRGGKTQSDLCPVTEGETVRTNDINAKQDATRPPARYNDATLLSAMESARKKLETGELRDAMAEKGLGTPATRAQTIEGLIEQKYLRRDGRDLIPNAKAFQLMQLVRGLHIDELTQPKLTAEWEQKLAQIESGAVSRDVFMDEIRRMTETIVSAAKQYEGDSVPIVNPIHFRNRCPACGGEIVENYKRFACTGEGCGFSLPKHPSGRAFEPEEVEELLATHHVGPLSGFISKRGFPFEGEVILAKDKETGEWGMRFDFEERPEVTEEEIAASTQIATCPLCHGRVIEHGDYYVCEHALGSDKKRCPMRTGKVILQRPISCAEVVALCENKRTPLLEGFVSKRTNRPFNAYLVLDKTKGVTFEFEKREKTSKAAKSAESAESVESEAAPEKEASEEAPKTATKRTKAASTTKTAAKKAATRTRKTTAKKAAEPTEA